MTNYKMINNKIKKCENVKLFKQNQNILCKRKNIKIHKDLLNIISQYRTILPFHIRQFFTNIKTRKLSILFLFLLFLSVILILNFFL